MARAGVNAGRSVIDRPRIASAKTNASSDEWAVVEFRRLMIIDYRDDNRLVSTASLARECHLVSCIMANNTAGIRCIDCCRLASNPSLETPDLQSLSPKHVH
jgi:hypothetical protein